jgi:hypothetical protein
MNIYIYLVVHFCPFPLIWILTVLNLHDITSKLRIIAMFVTVNT